MVQETGGSVAHGKGHFRGVHLPVSYDIPPDVPPDDCLPSYTVSTVHCSPTRHE